MSEMRMPNLLHSPAVKIEGDVTLSRGSRSPETPPEACLDYSRARRRCRSSSAMLSATISMSFSMARLSRPSSFELPFTSSFSGMFSNAQRVSQGEATSTPTLASAARRNIAG